MGLKGTYRLFIIVFVGGCAAMGASQLEQRFGKAEPRERLVEELPPQAIDYWSVVKPVVDKR